MDHSHGDGLLHRPFDEYAMAVDCRWCNSAAGVRCVVLHGSRRMHVTREDKATRWLNRDVLATPWREDRTPGACYSTLPGCQ